MAPSSLVASKAFKNLISIRGNKNNRTLSCGKKHILQDLMIQHNIFKIMEINTNFLTCALTEV